MQSEGGSDLLLLRGHGVPVVCIFAVLQQFVGGDYLVRQSGDGRR